MQVQVFSILDDEPIGGSPVRVSGRRVFEELSAQAAIETATRNLRKPEIEIVEEL